MSLHPPPPVHVTVWDERTGQSGETAVLVHGTLTWGPLCFVKQRELAARHRLVVMDRRGFGCSPDLDNEEYTSDYAVDAKDVVELLGDGAHLVGHSYGGVVAMLACAARPDLVMSLALIEPAAHMAAVDEDLVAEAIQQARAFMAQAKRRGPEEYLEQIFGASGRPRPEPRAMLERAARSALHERPAWLADLPLSRLAAARMDKVVIAGKWDILPQGYLQGTSDALRLTSLAVAEKIKGKFIEVADAGHEVHRDQPVVVNKLLDQLWSAPQRAWQ
jgi:pimeloyl-ACP methyl ester carboxylesterase